MMSFLLGLKSKLYLVGAFLVAALGVLARVAFLKQARNKAEEKVEVLKAQAHANKIKSKIVKEESSKLSLKESEIKEKVEKKGENFEGVDNLTNSNDF